MLINFTKMQGLGNDFVVIDLLKQNMKQTAPLIRHIADRHEGIGCDQVLFIEPSENKTSDFFYRIYNANGHEVEQCGNGARCVAWLFYHLGYSASKTLTLDTIAGTLECVLEEEDKVTVNMGIPKFAPKEIPFRREKQSSQYSLEIEGQEIHFSALSIGNPHAIIKIPSLQSTMVKKAGSFISKHPDFPKGTNVEFMEILDPEHIRLRVYERGVGETLACGSGACAAVIAGILHEGLKNAVNVAFSTGNLEIRWAGLGEPVFMTGPVNRVFIGQLQL